MHIIEVSNVFPFPWKKAPGIAKLVLKNGNYMVQLSQGQFEHADFGQSIIFRNTNAKLNFNIYLMKNHKGSHLELLLRNPNSGKEIVVTTHSLANLSSGEGLSLAFSANNEFIKLVRDNPGQLMDVLFRLKGNQNTMIGLDNIEIVY